MLAVAGAAFAQGNVNWVTLSPANITFNTNSTTASYLTGGTALQNGAIGAAGGSASLGTGFYYALLYQASGSQLTAANTLAGLTAWSFSGLMASNSPTAGRLTAINPNAGSLVPWGPGSDSIMMVGWSANLGATWAAAFSSITNGIALNNFAAGSFFGESSTGFTGTASTSTSPGASMFGSAATAFGTPINSAGSTLFELVNTPEPTTMALAGLGGLSLLALRRKK